MATLQTIRDRAGLLVAVIIGISILAFVLGDMFGGGGSTTLGMKKKMEIAEIAGQSVSYIEYDQRVNDLVEIYKLSGQTNLDEATMQSIQQQSWDQMVREYIMADEYKKLGLEVSSEELFDLIQGENPHMYIQQLFTDPQTGIFDRGALIRFLKNLENDETGNQRAYWMFMETQIHDEQLFSKYIELIRKGLYVTRQHAENKIEESTAQYDFNYMVKRFNQVPDTAVTITENDMKKYYNEHKHDYEQTASRSIDYVVFEVTPSSQDVKAAEEWVNEIYDDFTKTRDIAQFVNANSDEPFDTRNYEDGELPEIINDFMFQNEVGATFGPYFENETYKISRLAAVNQVPDSVRARHILIAPDEQRSMQEAKNAADSLKNLIENGTDFALLATMNSVDQGSAQLGGDLGWFADGMMVQPFNDACFYGNTGDLTIVESQFGYHIIEILNQSAKSKKVRVGTLVRRVKPSSNSIQNYYSQASQFAGLNNTYQKFIAAIEEQGLNKRVAMDIKENDQQIPGLESPRLLIRSIYETEKNQIVLDFNDQAVFELEDKFVVAYVTDVKEKGVAPFEQVQSDVELQVRLQKKGELLAQRIEQSSAEASSLEDLANTLDASVEEVRDIKFTAFSIPNLGVEPRILGTLVSLPENQLSPPVIGNNGVYVVEVTSVLQGEIPELETEKNNLLFTYQNRANFEAYNALKANANIEDQRSKFY
jgi:peptidyl-prolyl cis-trans isomerase D